MVSEHYASLGTKKNLTTFGRRGEIVKYKKNLYTWIELAASRTSNWLLAIVMSGKCSITLGFQVLYLYTSELFPTGLRSQVILVFVLFFEVTIKFFIIILCAEKSISKSCYFTPNLDCKYTFTIVLTPNGIVVWGQINRRSVITIRICCNLTIFSDFLISFILSIYTFVIRKYRNFYNIRIEI